MNSQSFTPKEVEKGLVEKLIHFLLTQNYEFEDSYNEIHITSDGYCTIVEWTTVPYNHEYGGTFQYVDEEHYVAKEIRFPDGHYEYAFSEEGEKELWENFLKENPGWKKNGFGIWVNEEEENQLRKELLGED